MGGSGTQQCQRCRTLKYHYSGRYFAHSIRWERVGLGRRACKKRASAGSALILEPRRVRTQDKACGVGLRGVGSNLVPRGPDVVRPPASASPTQVEDIVRWGVWLGRHIC